MSEVAPKNIRTIGSEELVYGVCGRSLWLIPLSLVISAATITCAVKSLTLPDEINAGLMRTEQARLASLTDNSKVSTVSSGTQLKSAQTHISGTNLEAKKRQKKISKLSVHDIPTDEMKSPASPISTDQNDLQKLKENFKGGQWDEE